MSLNPPLSTTRPLITTHLLITTCPLITTWLGHVIRQGEGAASFEALRKAVNIGDIEGRRRGWNAQIRWVDVVNKDLSRIGLDIVKAKTAAADRSRWAATVDRCLRCWASS